jgi:hypothetical protein
VKLTATYDYRPGAIGGSAFGYVLFLAGFDVARSRRPVRRRPSAGSRKFAVSRPEVISRSSSY